MNASVEDVERVGRVACTYAYPFDVQPGIHDPVITTQLSYPASLA
jgi:alpha-D-ribose 1-methylphosphonate 5-phosphate C-P lyase